VYFDSRKTLDNPRLKPHGLWISSMVSAAIALAGSPAYAKGQLPNASKALSYESLAAAGLITEQPISVSSPEAIMGNEIVANIEFTEATPLDHVAQANPTPQETLEIPPEPIFEPTPELQPSEPTSDPVLSEPTLSDPTLSEPDLLDPTLSEPDLLDHLLDPTLSEPDLLDPTLSEPDLLDPTLSEPDLPDSGLPDPDLSEPEATDLSSDPIPSKGWQFSLSPYFFAPFNIDADVTVAGRSTSIDAGLDDVLNLDRAFTGGLRFEGQSNRWGFILDGFYLYAEDSGSLGGSFSARSLLEFVQQTSPGRLDEFVQQFDPQQLEQLTQIGQQIGQQVNLDTPVPIRASGTASVRQIRVDAAVSYRAVDVSLDNSPDADFYPRLVIAPLLGIRTNFLRQTIEVDSIRIANREIPEDAIPSVNREFRESVTLVDPLLGAEIALALSDRWSLELQGDISGFGLGADRNLGWNLAFGTQFNFSRSVGLQLLYRFNGFDYADGDGRDRIELDLEQNGLQLTTTFRF